MSTPRSQPSPDCFGCAIASSVLAPPGGVIHRTDHWIVNHCDGPLGCGTLVVSPSRHVTRVSALNQPEVAEMGPLLHRTTQIVDELTKADQVYVCLWSHSDSGPKHLHWVVQPVSKMLVAKHAGKRSEELQLAMFELSEMPDMHEVESFSASARELFRSESR